MDYQHIVPALFLNRPNRFVAHCLLDGREETVHVKNTGRCKELLLPGESTVYLEESENPKRKTRYSLVAVQKGGLLINMDSQAPNRVVGEALRAGTLTLPGMGPVTFVKPESSFGHSRFDFYVEAGEQKGYIEVKGVTLEEGGRAYFPDAPTIRGLRHVEELILAKKEGYHAFLILLVQFCPVCSVSPNDHTQPAFGDALAKAQRAGVELCGFDCLVTPESITLGQPVPVELGR